MNPKQDPYFNNPLPNDPVIATSFLTILILHLFFRTTRHATTVMITGIRSILMAMRAAPGTIDLIPQDPRTIVNKIDLDPRTTSYLQCPACFALYPFPGTGFHCLPPGTIEHCTHRPTPESTPCGVPLWKEHRVGATTLKSPSRKYIHQSLKEWMGRLLTRPGVEDVLDSAYDTAPVDRLTDIWDSPVLKNFRDVDGTPFFARHGDEARFAFSLGADSFHPLGSLEAKQSMSATAIYMVLLNFPKEQRFKYKNMYLVGVIPGPSKPSLAQINHVLSLLVLELLEFWRGVYYTRTFKFPGGRFSKGAMIPLVADMLGARQVAGFGSVTSMFFCTFCMLTIQDIENLQKHTWPECTFHNHLSCAREWRDCQSERDREHLFKLHGVRWSPLLELPYWNPILYTVLDSMHAAFLGLFQSHCRKVWRIDVSVEGGDGSLLHIKKPVPRPPNAKLRQWVQLIQANPRNLLERLTAESTPRNTLWHICVDNGLRHAGTKRALAKGIVEWVCSDFRFMFYSYSTLLQRSQISRGDITLPEAEDMEVDRFAPPGPSKNDDWKASAEKALRESRSDKALARRENKDALRALCQDRGLDDTLCKIALARQLIAWVSPTSTVLYKLLPNMCSATSTCLVMIPSNLHGQPEAFLERTSCRKCGMT